MAAFSSKAGISAPGLPQLMTFLRAAASSRAVRKLAPVGASSRSFSPFAKAPWQSEQPLDFQTSNPTFTLSPLCANATLQPKAIATADTMVLRAHADRPLRERLNLVLNDIIGLHTHDLICLALGLPINCGGRDAARFPPGSRPAPHAGTRRSCPTSRPGSSRRHPSHDRRRVRPAPRATSLLSSFPSKIF